MSIVDSDDAMVWRERPPDWSRDIMVWDRTDISSRSEWPCTTIMARCCGVPCSECCVTLGRNNVECRCGAEIVCTKFRFTIIYVECASCGSRVAICRMGICCISTPLINSIPEDTI